MFHKEIQSWKKKKQLVDFYAQPSPRTVRARSQAFEDEWLGKEVHDQGL